MLDFYLILKLKVKLILLLKDYNIKFIIFMNTKIMMYIKNINLVFID